MSIRIDLPANCMARPREDVLRRGEVAIVRQRSGVAFEGGDVYVRVPLILVVADGRKAIQCNQRWVTVSAGQAVFVEPGIYGMYDEEPTGEALMIFFEPEFVASFCERHPDLPLLPATPAENRMFVIALNPFVLASLESLPLFLRQDLRPSPVLIEHKLDEFVLSLLDADARLWHALVSSEQPARRLVAYVDSQRRFRRSLKELARGAGQSLSTFKRQFRAATGSAPATYLRTKRLALAKLLLETTGKSVTDIAFDVGFASPSHFVQAFRKQYRLTPTGVRKRQNHLDATSVQMLKQE